MNTADMPGRPYPPGSDLETAIVDPKDTQIERLQIALRNEQSNRRSERFVALVMMLILLDGILFLVMPWYADILVFLLDVILIVLAAYLCQLPGIHPLLQNAFDTMRGSPQRGGMA
jgi:hypothetical protein